MMFSFTDHNPDWVYVFVPEQVRFKAKEYAQKHCESSSSFAGRNRMFTDLLLDCVCGWAFSKWCTQNNIWHECNYSDANDADVIVEDTTLGLSSFVISSRFAGGGIDPSREGVRITNWRLENEDVDFYLSASFDSRTVTFYGLAEKKSIQNNQYVWDLRPLVYDMPADHMTGTMRLFTEACRKTEEKQEVFGGLFKEK